MWFCLLADYDLIYVDEYEKIIIYAFEKNKNYDIITFKVEGIYKEFKKSGLSEKK